MLRFSCLAALAIAAPLLAQRQTQALYTLRGDRVAIYNLVGEVRIVEGRDRDVVVAVRRQGSDASQLRVETGDLGGVQTLRVLFPFDRVRYRDPRHGYREANIRVEDDGTFGEGPGRRRIDISRRRGASAAADLVIQVPPGTTIELNLGVGVVIAEGTSAELDLDVMAADVDLKRTRGAVRIQTASGRVDAKETEGDLHIDTASGSVTLRVPESTGADVDLRTRSGKIHSEVPIDIRGQSRGELRGQIGDGASRITVSTESGGIRIRRA